MLYGQWIIKLQYLVPNVRILIRQISKSVSLLLKYLIFSCFWAVWVITYMYLFYPANFFFGLIPVYFPVGVIMQNSPAFKREANILSLSRDYLRNGIIPLKAVYSFVSLWYQSSPSFSHLSLSSPPSSFLSVITLFVTFTFQLTSLGNFGESIVRWRN